MILYLYLRNLIILFLYLLILLINFHIFLQIDKINFRFFINQLLMYLFFILIFNLHLNINITLIINLTFKNQNFLTISAIFEYHFFIH